MTHHYSKEDVLAGFEEVFAYPAQAAYFSPGRINLIGEHTDYNGGHVFPAAISLGTFGAVAARSDRLCRLYSANFKEEGLIEWSLDSLASKEDAAWTAYVKGVLSFIREAGYELAHGFDLYVYGTIPNGAGLSSSASLELLVGIMAQDLYGLDISRLDLVKIGKRCENDYIGVQSGIMDQFAIGMGQEKGALYLDTETLEFEEAPIELGNRVILIMNTNKRRELATSKYNERRGECEAALADLQKELDITSLGQLSLDVFDEYAYLIEDDLAYKRARHAVAENERTKRAKEALEAKDLDQFGRLMNASHVSLERDYEVTGKELDCLVHTAWKQEGVLGARMTGAGFGGCALALLDKDQVESFKQAVSQVYLQEMGYEPSFYLAEIAVSSQKL